jgi:hypothetical protein
MVSAVTFRAPSWLIKAPPLADPRPPTRVCLGRRRPGAQQADSQGLNATMRAGGYWPEMNVALSLSGDMGWPLTALGLRRADRRLGGFYRAGATSELADPRVLMHPPWP